MGEEVSKTVKNLSDGTVKISIERYEDLLAKAAEKAPIVYKTVHKTPKMVAQGNMLWGGVFIAGGSALFTIGAIVYTVGSRQARKL